MNPLIKEEKNRFVGGHTLCPGCGEGIIIKNILNSIENKVIVINATGCLEVSSTTYPHSSWNVPWIHIAFENASAVASGIEAAYNSLIKQKKLNEKITFLIIGGDGATYDIGLQSLSGAIERGHDFIYLLLDNEAYMNTGVQRSSGTPLFAETKTTPYGKKTKKKDIMKIIIAHNIKYCASVSPSNMMDLKRKVKKANTILGPKFIHAYSPCPLGWGFESCESINIAKLAVETNLFPLYEYENEKYTINYIPKQKPIIEYLKTQKRFKQIINNQEKIKEIQETINHDFQNLIKLSKN